MNSQQVPLKRVACFGLPFVLFGCAFPEMKVKSDESAGASGERATGGTGGLGSASLSGGNGGTHATFGGSISGGTSGRDTSSIPAQGGNPSTQLGLGGNGLGGNGLGGTTVSSVGGLGGTNSGGTNSGGTNSGGTNSGGTNSGGTNSGGTNSGGSSAVVSSCSVQVATTDATSCSKPLICGSDSCCTSLVVPGGTFPMGRSTSSSSADYFGTVIYEIPEHTATVATFALDKYEVTVGRFRAFVGAYSPWTPSYGSGAKPGTASTGWGQSWSAAASDLPVSRDALKATLNCYAEYQTWTDAPSVNENAPINCVTWPLAFAFCIWDRGRLPTEAEWEYAAAGGNENRLYPWGSEPPTVERAVYYDTDAGSYGKPTDPVGSKPLGKGCFGHLDLSGSMWEWVFDWYSLNYYGTTTAPRECVDCANVDGANSPGRGIRGGCWATGADDHRAANRWRDPPATSVTELGFRCARDLL
ncbi:MAG: formylglycine-generating enzyme family protein [Polyangiaceae bacterium]